MHKKVLAFPLLFLVLSVLLVGYGCGKNNLFSWAHKAGGNTSTAALQSDAYTALQDKDYSKAMEYYSKILHNEPENSEAIYGYSIAKLADSGLNIGDIISSFVNEQQNAPSNLSIALRNIANSSQSSNDLLPASIITNIVNIRNAMDEVLPLLNKIAQGKADGKINPRNVNVNINLAFCYILRAAMKVVDSGINFTDDYKVEGTSNDTAFIQDVGRDLIIAYYRLLIVCQDLNLTNKALLAEIKEDANSLIDELKTQTGVALDISHDPLLE